MSYQDIREEKGRSKKYINIYLSASQSYPSTEQDMNIFKDSIFGQLLILWKAPIDGTKLDLSQIKQHSKIKNNQFPVNLIIGQRP